MANFSDIVSPLVIGTVNIGGGSNVTLTTVQTNPGTILLTGALTANIIVYFPARLKIWSVVNNTTGAFTVTLAMTGGANTVSVAQGFSREFYSDGTTGVYVLGSDVAGSNLTVTNTPVSATNLSASGTVSFTSTGAVQLPSGTTAQQPVSPITSMVRYNTTTSRFEFYNGSAWINHVRLNGDTMTGSLTTPALVGSSTSATLDSYVLGSITPLAASVTTLAASGIITSTLATGTAPFTVASTTNVANLNASSLNGATFASPGNIGTGTAGSAAHTTISASGQITSTVTTGTAPLVVASTTNVANLNASSLNGATFTAPGSIGSGTAGSAAFTTISATGVITSTLATGTAPFTVASTTNVANLNASSLNGATFAAPGNIGTTTAGTGKFTTLTATTSILPFTDAAVTLGAAATRLLHTYEAGISVNSGTNVAVPTTGGTVTVAQTTNCQICQPAGTLAALTIQFPTPLADGHAFELSITQSITALTLTPNSGASIVGSFTAVTNYLATKYRYVASTTTWYEVV